MQIHGEILDMCLLVAFVEKEKEYALGQKLVPETYAQEVLERYKKLCPNAELIMGDIPVQYGYCCDYVRCGIDGVWEFFMSKGSIIISVKTDGTIHLDEGTAEEIFNYQND